MATSYNFDEQSVRRIVRAVLNDEKRRVNQVQNPRPFNRRFQEQVQEVAITSAIAAPTWSGTTGRLTPTSCDFPVFFPYTGTGTATGTATWTIEEGTTLEFQSFLNVAITAPATGKYKRGIVIGGKLIQVACTDEDLPTGWGS